MRKVELFFAALAIAAGLVFAGRSMGLAESGATAHALIMCDADKEDIHRNYQLLLTMIWEEDPDIIDEVKDSRYWKDLSRENNDFELFYQFVVDDGMY